MLTVREEFGHSTLTHLHLLCRYIYSNQVSSPHHLQLVLQLVQTSTMLSVSASLTHTHTHTHLLIHSLTYPPLLSPAHLCHSGVKVHILLYHIFLGLLVSVDLTELSSLLGSDVSLLGYPSITQDTSVYSRILSVYLECGLSYSHG